MGFANGRNLLFLDQPGARITIGSMVHKMGGGHSAMMGPALLGRVIDPEGAPLDALPPPECGDARPLAGKMQNPLARQPVTKPLGDYLIKTYDAEQLIGGRFWDRASGGDMHDLKRVKNTMW